MPDFLWVLRSELSSSCSNSKDSYPLSHLSSLIFQDSGHSVSEFGPLSSVCLKFIEFLSYVELVLFIKFRKFSTIISLNFFSVFIPQGLVLHVVYTGAFNMISHLINTLYIVLHQFCSVLQVALMEISL